MPEEFNASFYQESKLFFYEIENILHGYNYNRMARINRSSGSREIKHTADWALEVWAEDLPDLLQAATEGMYALMGIRVDKPFESELEISLDLSDNESLLVTFLSELLFRLEQEKIAYYLVEVNFIKDTTVMKLRGGRAILQSKEIKAVTYHDMQIRKTKNGLRTTIVFDV
jgi:SHS2 domain-containing protein